MNTYELYFANITRDNAGTYTCLAKNPKTGLSNNTTISIDVTCKLRVCFINISVARFVNLKPLV